MMLEKDYPLPFIKAKKLSEALVVCSTMLLFGGVKILV
jgi:hypothetical protein